MQKISPRDKGFSLLEFVIACGILALMVAISVPLYQDYNSRAQATELVLLYDELRSGMRADLDRGIIEDCYSLRTRFSDDGRLNDYDVGVSLGFDKITGGFKPVMVVTATTTHQGQAGMRLARAALEQLDEVGAIDRSMVHSTMISFSSKLSDRIGPDCLQVPTPPPSN